MVAAFRLFYCWFWQIYVSTVCQSGMVLEALNPCDDFFFIEMVIG